LRLQAEKLPWSAAKQHSTPAHLLFLAAWARMLPWKEVAMSFHSCSATICKRFAPIFRAYLLNEGFQQFWSYNSPAWAGKFLDFRCFQVMDSRIEPMKKFARTLRAHRELLLNYFKARKEFSGGVVEGLNNKARSS